uniref:Uncharacterized protein n=1 Tax=Trichuris muris TaxID=70415 RepID=A0A5S6QX63_TRIMR
MAGSRRNTLSQSAFRCKTNAGWNGHSASHPAQREHLEKRTNGGESTAKAEGSIVRRLATNQRWQKTFPVGGVEALGALAASGRSLSVAVGLPGGGPINGSTLSFPTASPLDEGGQAKKKVVSKLQPPARLATQSIRQLGRHAARATCASLQGKENPTHRPDWRRRLRGRDVHKLVLKAEQFENFRVGGEGTIFPVKGSPLELPSTSSGDAWSKGEAAAAEVTRCYQGRPDTMCK